MLMPTPNASTLPRDIQEIIDGLMSYSESLSFTRPAADLIRELYDQLHPQPLLVDLNHNTMTRAGVVVTLSPNQAVLMNAMAECYPRAATLPDLAHALWGHGMQARNVNTVRVMMSDLRRVSTSVKAKIQNENKVGYRLELLPI